MTSHVPSYHGYRFPPEIISHAVWLYHRFCLSFRDAEDLLAQRGITVTYETTRQWCQHFGLDYARRLRRRRGRMGDTWYLDELFVTIQGQRQYLWRAVDQDGDVIDVLVPLFLRTYLCNKNPLLKPHSHPTIDNSAVEGCPGIDGPAAICGSVGAENRVPSTLSHVRQVLSIDEEAQGTNAPLDQ